MIIFIQEYCDFLQMDPTSMPTLLQWLVNIDLEEYHDKLVGLGVKKVKHVKECNRDHLSKIGMLELEIERFLKRANSTAQTASVTSSQVKPTLEIHLPSPSFGQTRLDVSEDTLKKEYSELWYTNPQNFKQRICNQFILKMCASASWKFDIKRKLVDWARKERDFRWNIMLSFAKEEDVAQETLYFKDQCILHQISKLKGQYKDFMFSEIESDKQVKEIRYARVQQCFKEAKDLRILYELAETKLQERYDQVLSKAGLSEEEEFLKKMKKVAQEISGSVETFFERATRVHERYVRVLGENVTLKQKEDRRNKDKNKRKARVGHG